MVRPLRIEYPNAWYHVTCRGNQRMPIFTDDRDRCKFLDSLIESLEAFQVELHCYAIMKNHFHFLLKTPKANLGRFMHRFNTAYITYYNLRHQRSGHLYQGRYKAILIEADRYLLKLSRYIHLNPVKIKEYDGLTIEEQAEKLNQYRWSSLHGYIKLRGRNNFTHHEMILGYMGGDTKKGRARYRGFVLQGLKIDLENPFQETRANAILGSDSFTVWVKENYLSEMSLPPRDFTHLRGIKNVISAKRIAEIIASEYEVEPEKIIKSRSIYKEARQVMLEICYRLNYRKMSLRKMGEEVGGISGERITQVHKLVREKVAEDRILRDLIDKLTDKILT